MDKKITPTATDKKKSFVVYQDQGEFFHELSDEDAGKLIKHIFLYEDGNAPELSGSLKFAFIGIRQSLDRNRKKHENVSKVRSEAGVKGAKAKHSKDGNCQNDGSKADNSYENDSDSDSDSENDSDNENDSESRYSPEARDIADKLLESILSWKPDYKCPCKSVMLGWVDACDKAIRIDARKPERMLEIIKWLPSHEGRGGFTWRANVLSGTTLRKQFDRLDIAINEDNKPVSRHGSGEYEQVIDIPEVQ